MIILKVTEKHCFTPSLEDALLEKLQKGGQIDPPDVLVSIYCYHVILDYHFFSLRIFFLSTSQDESRKPNYQINLHFHYC